MKTIGLLGGMSWESTTNYYKAINEGVKSELGGFHSAKIAMYSVDFAEIAALQHNGDWQQAATILSQAAQAVESAGADCLLICTNTMHKVADDVASSVSIPLIHIADATAIELNQDERRVVGLLGTTFTMEQSFYKERLEAKGIKVLVPNGVQRKLVHDIIYRELVLGEVKMNSRQDYLEVIADLREQGAEAIILGCTEIAMLINEEVTQIPLYDTTQIHSAAAVKFAIDS
ncbi:aspartate/glutamate racemase family protein [Vibrio methylphosphonaticus]|uniref:aspartate/glutamate racemase family protein n=1 Tax=Vibrio methylphosphonaticus TaxID=2946866 RepID=UPI00202AAF37|nr:aspartate/glutamate racemase family protein [Vibrio methylphosphonaticus]MCL9773655.1 aspartate/glutamate racemase family protein [Vibrio methylphosphonaticus]